MTPKVSIILPAYNCVKYLPDSVSSVLSQDFMDFELLIIDDGSTDGTGEFIRKNFSDQRVIYIRQEHSGLPAARNNGLEHARGEFIAFLDADDILLPQKLKFQVEALEKNNSIDAVYTTEKYFFEDDKDRLVGSPHTKLSGDLFFFLKRSNFIHVSTVMLRRASLGGIEFDAALRSHEDWDFFLRFSAKGARFRYLPEPLSLVRVRKTSMTAVNPVMDESRGIVGGRARMLWKKIKKESPLRYLSCRIRAKMAGFPHARKFNMGSPFEEILGGSDPKLVFGSSVHKNFESFLDLYKGVKKFYADPVYLFASNEGLGKPFGNLVRIESRRNYKWRRSHNFIFDAAEALKDHDFDYFVALDSDCLICNGAMKGFLKNREFDFIIYPNLNGLGGWYHGNIFRDNISAYLDILKALNLRRRDDGVVGNFNPLIVLSKKACDFLRGSLGAIESSDGYKKLMSLDFSVGETLIFNLLKDAGFKSADIDPALKRGLRYRPHWEAYEFRDGICVYHPVRLKYRDLFRRFAGMRCGYDKNYMFMPFIYAALIYQKALGLFFRKDKFPKEDDTWFNA